MPIKIPEALPAAAMLEKENIFTITESRAMKQDIRPLKIAILNLMPTKIATETQLARVLANSPLQVEMTLVQMIMTAMSSVWTITIVMNSAATMTAMIVV